MNKFCSECGVESKENAAFCSAKDCGKLFADSSVPSAATPAPPSPSAPQPQMTQQEKDAILYGGTPPASASIAPVSTPAVIPAVSVSPTMPQTSVDPDGTFAHAVGHSVAHPAPSMSQKNLFSIAVKVICVVLILFAFLPFVSVSCDGMTLSLNAYQLATGNIASSIVDSTAGLGIGAPSAAEMDQLNQMIPTNPILIVSYMGVLLLFAISFVPTLRRLELILAFAVSTFYLAIVIQFMSSFLAVDGLMSNIADAIPFGASPDMQVNIGIGAIGTVFACLALVAFAANELWQRYRG